ncbi:MAG: hypothetical protein LBR11_10060 [Deltaproteobacteria bacterium]|jgi:hypothetical protein|nr:hypothetical protein [Deltaproteobacteria bacterium]
MRSHPDQAEIDLQELTRSFINSPVVADCFLKRAWVGDLLEAAWLVNVSFRPLAEKMAAWSRLASGLADRRLPRTVTSEPIVSLKQRLSLLGQHYASLIAEFQSSSDQGLYALASQSPDGAARGDDFVNSEPGGIFRDLTTAQAVARKIVQTVGASSSHYRVSKFSLDSVTSIVADFDGDDRLRDIFSRPGLSGSGVDFLAEALVNLPTPFATGDILGQLTKTGELFPCVWARRPKKIRQSEAAGSASGTESATTLDFEVGAYFLEDDLLIWKTDIIMSNLIYYKDKMCGKEEVLTYVSHLLKGHLSLNVFFGLWERIQAKSELEALTRNLEALSF